MTDPDYMTRMQHDDGFRFFQQRSRRPLTSKRIAELRNRPWPGMTAEQSHGARPIPGKWSTVEVVSHLAGSELFFTDRMERTIAMERPLLMSVDERPYPERMKYEALDLGEELEMFWRAAAAHDLEALCGYSPPDAWKRTAIHSGSGLVTLRQLVFQPGSTFAQSSFTLHRRETCGT